MKVVSECLRTAELTSPLVYDVMWAHEGNFLFYPSSGACPAHVVTGQLRPSAGLSYSAMRIPPTLFKPHCAIAG